MRKTAIIACVGVLAVVVGVSFFSANSSLPQATSKGTLDVTSVRSDIRQDVSRLGSASAYENFKKDFLQSNPDVQHNAAHIFGEVAYELEKVEGIAACDTSFNFGCYHGFFTAGVKSAGISIVPELDAICQKSNKVGACQHGIGHGILEFLGHSKLEAALEVCKMTRQPNPIAGCTSGVFMEYNVPLMVENGIYTVSARPLGNPESPYAPCTNITGEYVRSCYHELPQWWNQVYGGDFSRMGVLCAGVSDPRERYSCFAGIGNIAGSSTQYDPEHTLVICKLYEPNDADTCLENAAWAYASNLGLEEEAMGICKMVSENRREKCIQSL
jgi:hypothetical protein